MNRLFTILTVTVFVLTVMVAAVSANTGITGAKEVFTEACSKCHPAERALKRKKDQAAWEKTIDRMSKYAKGKYKAPIPEETQTKIVSFLTARYVFDTYCTACHSAERVLKATLDRSGWDVTVKTMQDLGAEVPEDSRELLIDYLTEYGRDNEW